MSVVPWEVNALNAPFHASGPATLAGHFGTQHWHTRIPAFRHTKTRLNPAPVTVGRIVESIHTSRRVRTHS